MFHFLQGLGMGRRGIRTTFCSKCNAVKELSSKRYCRSCANTYMIEWRKSHPLNDFQKAKAKTRHHTHMLVRRGNLIKQVCESCGDVKVQAHHEDYTDPYNVHWLCSKCHKEHHIEQSYDEWKRKQLSFTLP
jgi:ribosomal protein S27AE